jgi:hypothetical protein
MLKPNATYFACAIFAENTFGRAESSEQGLEKLVLETVPDSVVEICAFGVGGEQADVDVGRNIKVAVGGAAAECQIEYRLVGLIAHLDQQ